MLCLKTFSDFFGSDESSYKEKLRMADDTMKKLTAFAEENVGALNQDFVEVMR